MAPAQLHQPCCCTVTQSCPTLCDPLNGQHASSHTQFSSVAQSCLTLCDPMDFSTPGLPVHHQCPEFTQTHVIEWVIPSNHLILYRPLLLPSIFPRIWVFPNKSDRPIMWSEKLVFANWLSDLCWPYVTKASVFSPFLHTSD